MTGPENFLGRLNSELCSYSLPDYSICNPTIEGYQLSKKKGVRIARIDGCYFYKFSAKNLENFLKIRYGYDLKIATLFDSLFLGLTKLFNIYLNRYIRRVIRNSNGIVFQSQISKEMYLEFMGKITKPHKVIYNGVPLDKFYPKDLNGAINKKIVNIVITANFRPHKRLIDAINLINELNRNRKSVLHVVGKIDSVTLKEVSTLDRSNCIFHGQLEEKEIILLYSKMHIGLSPSIFDPCPNSVVEMLACGLPVISTQKSGAAELVNNPDMIVNEPIEMEYLEFQNPEMLPKICVNSWITTINKILTKYSYYRLKTWQNANSHFDIKKTANEYAEFILKLRNGS